MCIYMLYIYYILYIIYYILYIYGIMSLIFFIHTNTTRPRPFGNSRPAHRTLTRKNNCLPSRYSNAAIEVNLPGDLSSE